MTNGIASAPTALRAVLVAALMLLAGMALAAALPALTGRVVDDAGLIDPPTRAAIEQKLADYEKKSSDQIVVATIESLDGEDIESYANRLFRAWKLGQAKENNGVLLLVAKNDRKMRIEVGYGLEGTLTDLHSKLIIENTMVPAFRAGDFSGGISKAVDDIIMVLSGNAAELEARAARNQQSADHTSLPGAIFVALWAGFFIFAIGIGILAPIFGRRIGPNRYRWLGMVFSTGGGGGGYSGGGGGWSSGGGGGFSGGGGSSGGGGASGGW